MDKKEIKMIGFHSSHLDLMEFRDHEATNICIDNYKDRFTTLSKLGACGTVVYNGKVLCAIGALDMWKGVCEVWVLPSKAAQEHKLIFARLIKRQLEALISLGHYHRIQVTALNDDFHNKFFEWLGFRRETPDGMKNYTIEKNNYNMWSKT